MYACRGLIYLKFLFTLLSGLLQCEEVKEGLRVKNEVRRRGLKMCDETIANYKLTNMTANKAVGKANNDAYKNPYNSLAKKRKGREEQSRKKNRRTDNRKMCTRKNRFKMMMV